ncbi:hypothetical protein FIBSPDRAFT_68470 [Athelia psychrophila]|uniref:Uncharacterized protein n=1 Tax=Athelia psychrophila TaxID=1759441 RepID=A0A166ER42_9AGAM|nr:hypothetical protein FIBSPDRAFT_68470 [Fibularhizoctonia sp. CBS 109695]
MVQRAQGRVQRSTECILAFIRFRGLDCDCECKGTGRAESRCARGRRAWPASRTCEPFEQFFRLRGVGVRCEAHGLMSTVKLRGLLGTVAFDTSLRIHLSSLP